MNFLSIKYFLTTCNELSFTKAANSLYITQQTLSSNIQNLEKELGVKLFIRNTPLKLTYEGEVFYKYAKKFEILSRSLEDEFSDINKENKGLLKIGSAHTRGKILLPNITFEFKKIYPNVKIEIIESDNDDLEKMLLLNEIDIAIYNPKKPNKNIKYIDYYTEEIVFVISKTLISKKDFSFDKFKTIPLLLNNKDDIAGRISNIYLENYKNLNICASSNNIETLLDMALKNLGGCFSPNLLVKNILTKKDMENLNIFKLDEKAVYNIYFGILENRYYPKYFYEFINIAQNIIKL